MLRQPGAAPAINESGMMAASELPERMPRKLPSVV